MRTLDWRCSSDGETNIYWILIGKISGKRPFENSEKSQENDIMIGPKKLSFGVCEMDGTGSGSCPMEALVLAVLELWVLVSESYIVSFRSLSVESCLTEYTKIYCDFQIETCKNLSNKEFLNTVESRLSDIPFYPTCRVWTPCFISSQLSM
jgi:hypothetical protein